MIVNLSIISISVFNFSPMKNSEKSWTLFYNRLFYKALLIINRFLFRKLIHSAISSFLCQDDAKDVKGELEYGK